MLGDVVGTARCSLIMGFLLLLGHKLVEAWMLDYAIAVRNDLPRTLASRAIVCSMFSTMMLLLHREVGQVSI